MFNPLFNKGDIVKCIGANAHVDVRGITNGEIGVVIDCVDTREEDATEPYYVYEVKWDNYKNKTCWICEYEIELIKLHKRVINPIGKRNV